MFFKLFSHRFFIGVLVLVVCCVGILYFLQTQTRKDPVVIYKPTIVEKSTIPEGTAVSPNFPPVNPNEEPVEAAYKRLEYIKNNPYAWGGVHSERATELIAELMPPPVLVEHADGDKVYALIVELIAENHPRAAGGLITNICDGNISGRAMYDALVELAPLSVPHILPYLERGVAEGGHIRSGVFNTLSRIAAEYPSELGGITEHIIIPKIAKIAADKDFERYDSGTVFFAQAALARLGR